MAAIVMLSAVALLVGPLSARLRSAMASHALEAFVLVSVIGLLLLHALPHTGASLGASAGPLVVAGAALAWWHERRRPSTNDAEPSLSTWLAVALIGSAFVHAILDGVVIGADGDRLGALALGVVLHRVPVGIALWSVLRPRAGLPVTVAVATALIAGTVVGGLAGGELAARFALALHVVQALFIGALLFTMLTSTSARTAGVPHQTRERVGQLLGAIGGGGVVVGLGLLHHETSSLEALWELTVDSALPLLVAFLIVGALQASGRDVTPPTMGAHPLSQATIGAAVGLPTPLCSCSVVPLYRDLVRRGVPTPTAMAFLVAAPEVGVPAIMLSASMLGFELTVARTVGAFILAIAVGALVGGRVPATATPSMPRAQTTSSWSAFGQRTLDGTLDAIDHTGPWIALGLLVAAVAGPLLQGDVLALAPPGLDVVVAAVVGVPLYVCASGSTPVAASLLAQGVSPGAMVAFLWTGPATNLTTLGLLGRLHGARVATAFAATMAGVAIALGLGINAMGPVVAPAAAVAHEVGPLDVVGAALLGVLGLWSLWRQGVSGAVLQLSPAPVDGACPVHGEDCRGHASPLAAVPVVAVGEVAVATATFAPAKPRPSLMRPR